MRVCRFIAYLVLFVLVSEKAYPNEKGMLKEINVEETAYEIRIIIVGEKTLSALTSESKNPPEYVIELIDTIPGKYEGNKILNRGPIKRLNIKREVSSLASTRISILLSKEVEPSLEYFGKKMIIKIPKKGREVIKESYIKNKKEKLDENKTGDKDKKDKNENKKVPLRIIVAGDIKEIKDILTVIINGRPFESVARERSIDKRTKKRGGYVGVTDGISLNKEARERLRTLKEGEVSEIIPVGDGRYAILQIPVMKYYLEGMKEFKRGNLKESEIAFKKHLALNPDGARSYLMLGEIYKKKGNLNEAAEMYKLSYLYDPSAELIKKISNIEVKRNRSIQTISCKGEKCSEN